MAFLILSQLSVGVVLILLTIPLAKVGRGFFSFHVVMALAFEILALAMNSAPAHGAFAVSLLILVVLFQIRKLRWATPVLAISGILGVAALGIDAAKSHAAAHALARAGAILSCAAVLGSIIVTMNLGHWYLVIKGLPFEVLGAANRTFVRTLIAKMACIAIGSVLAADSWKALFGGGSADPVWYTTLFLTVRVSFGLVAPLILAWMVHECVKIRSNQSATGILYVMLVFVLIGEVSGMYFLIERGVPL